MVNFRMIDETFDERVTRRIESLNAVAGMIAASQMEAYREDNETDALVSISALSIVSNELEDILDEIELLSKVLLSFDKNENQTDTEAKQVILA